MATLSDDRDGGTPHDGDVLPIVLAGGTTVDTLFARVPLAKKKDTKHAPEGGIVTPAHYWLVVF